MLYGLAKQEYAVGIVIVERVIKSTWMGDLHFGLKMENGREGTATINLLQCPPHDEICHSLCFSCVHET